jgi:hypothetical protein
MIKFIQCKDYMLVVDVFRGRAWTYREFEKTERVKIADKK